MFEQVILFLMRKRKKSNNQDINKIASPNVMKHVAEVSMIEDNKTILLSNPSVEIIIDKDDEIPSTEIKDQPIKETQKEETITPVEVTVSEPIEVKHEKSFSNNFSDITPSSEIAHWLIVSASSIGRSHLKSDIPCQDNHYVESINEKWGITICCDGAGSAINSHLGSKYVATEIGIKFFKELIIKNGWQEKNTLPTQEEWNKSAREGCIQIYNSLEKLAHDKQIILSSLACTLIVVIYSPIGLLVTHIGDGRAGYCNEYGEWHSLITPHKGEEANQTIFITSQKWITDTDFIMSGKQVPESHVINEKPNAFTLMSDGCELHSFECSIMDPETNKWHDPNIPYPKFFNPLVKNLRSMHESKTSIDSANNKWRKFIEEGSAAIEAEPDDKTMILGVLI
ncbi:MAG: PP2C family serine/threonine-protein phosphatase [Bacteroidia bacterium]